MLASNVAIAGSVHGVGSVKNAYFHSKESVIYPAWKGTLQLEIDSLAWNIETDCNTQYVGVRENDTHIISAVLAAKMSGSPITVYANEDLKVTGSFCYVRAVGL
jgi:hypothetical protein